MPYTWQHVRRLSCCCRSTVALEDIWEWFSAWRMIMFMSLHKQTGSADIVCNGSIKTRFIIITGVCVGWLVVQQNGFYNKWILLSVLSILVQQPRICGTDSGALETIDQHSEYYFIIMAKSRFLTATELTKAFRFLDTHGERTHGWGRRCKLHTVTRGNATAWFSLQEPNFNMIDSSTCQC